MQRIVIAALSIMVLASTAVATDVRPASALRSVDQLLDARVPSMCGHPAGRLVDGALPGIAEGQGGVAIHPPQVVFGKIGRSAGRGAAAVFYCSRGGVGHPAHIVFYDGRKRIIGHVDLFDVTRGGRESVRRIWIRRGRVHAEVWGIAQDGDLESGGTAAAKVVFRWNPRAERVVVARTRVFDERAVAMRVVTAANRGDRVTVERLVDNNADLLIRSAASSESGLRMGDCFGQLDPLGSVLGNNPRGCLAWDDRGTFLFAMSRQGWRGWRIDSVLVLDGYFP